MVFGWAIGPRLTGDITEQALRMALTTRHHQWDFFITPIAGVNNAAGPYQQLLTTHGITASMSRKVND